MTQTNTFSVQQDPEIERKLALAKVYNLLIRLAEEAEEIEAKEKDRKTAPEQTSSIAHLKSNIPS